MQCNMSEAQTRYLYNADHNQHGVNTCDHLMSHAILTWCKQG